MKKYCLESGKDWNEGLPFILLVVRESEQESSSSLGLWSWCSDTLYVAHLHY